MSLDKFPNWCRADSAETGGDCSHKRTQKQMDQPRSCDACSLPVCLLYLLCFAQVCRRWIKWAVPWFWTSTLLPGPINIKTQWSFIPVLRARVTYLLSLLIVAQLVQFSSWLFAKCDLIQAWFVKCWVSRCLASEDELIQPRELCCDTVNQS